MKSYDGYNISPRLFHKTSGRRALNAAESRRHNRQNQSRGFYADDNIAHLLGIEAVKQSINLAKN